MAEKLTPHQKHYREVLAQGAKREKKSKNKLHEDRFEAMFKSRGLHVGMVREFRFHPKRMWRFDFAWPAQKVALEFQGGTFGRGVVCDKCTDGPGFPHKVMRTLKDGRRMQIREGGGHSTGEAIANDADKSNAAQVLGWKVFHAADRHTKTWEIVDMIARFVGEAPAKKQEELRLIAI